MNCQSLINKLLQDKVSLIGQVFGLVGTLGSGKTYLVKKLLEELEPGFVNQVTSPTFSLCNIYTSNQFIINHFDLYRLESIDDLEEIGFMKKWMILLQFVL